MNLFAVEAMVLEPAELLALDQVPMMAGRIVAAAEASGWVTIVRRSVATFPGVRRKIEGMSGPGSMRYLTEVREVLVVSGWRPSREAAWYQAWHRVVDEDRGSWSSEGGSVRDSEGYRMLGVTALTRYLSTYEVSG